MNSPLCRAAVLACLLPLCASAQLTFSFNYADTNTGFNDPAQGAARRTALEAAAQLIADQLSVTTPVVVTFDVTSNSADDSTLAAAGSASVGDDVGYSQTVVGQKIINGTDANGSAADGSVEWNFFHNWDLDNDVAPDAFDFISTAMHELLHAIGFVSAIDSAGNGIFDVAVGDPNGWYAFDQFLVTSTGAAVIDSGFRFDTSKLSILDDDPGLFFNGANAVAANGGNAVPIFTPDPWQEGSSGSHTDDNTFTGSNALLMNAATGTGPGVRTLSAIELGILKDLGFTFSTSGGDPDPDPDPDPDSSSFAYLSNISVLTNSGSGAEVLTAGFAIAGGDKPLLVRGIGPRLASFGVANTLPDPRIGINQSGAGELMSNDDWDASRVTEIAARVGAFALDDSTLDAALVTTLGSGAYTVEVKDVNDATGTALAEIYDTEAPTSASGPHLTNISARAQVGTGANVLTAGFVIAGSGTKALLIRGIGPTLGGFGVPGTLADPQIKLFKSEGGSSTQINSNDDWSGDDIVAAASRLGAFALTAGSFDAALLVNLQPGSYTVQLSGVGNTTGIGLIEVYDADSD